MNSGSGSGSAGGSNNDGDLVRALTTRTANRKVETDTDAIIYSVRPSVFGRNLPCEPVRKMVTREERDAIVHTSARFKRADVWKPNGILACKFLSKPKHRGGEAVDTAYETDGGVFRWIVPLE
jgi:hypothetical protein